MKKDHSTVYAECQWCKKLFTIHHPFKPNRRCPLCGEFIYLNVEEYNVATSTNPTSD